MATSSPVVDALAALPDERAAALAGVTLRQLHYWADTSLLLPSVSRRLSERNVVRLYDTQALLELLVVAELRKTHRWSLQHIRAVVAHLRDRGYELSEIVFAVDPKSKGIYFQTPDGTWEDDRLGRQTIISATIHLVPLRRRIRDQLRREPRTVGRLERRRGQLGSKLVVAGTRVPVATVESRLRRGATTAEILAAYPVLKDRDVDAVRRSLAS